EPTGTRLAAAEALAALQHEGLEHDARKLAAVPSGSDKARGRLIAATLLSQHGGPQGETLLLELGADQEPAVAAVAVRRLIAIRPLSLKPLLKQLVSNKDSRLRQLAAQALRRFRSVEAVGLLIPLLDDPEQSVRTSAREALIELAAVEGLRQ